MTMLVRGGATPAGSALPATATAGQVLQWNGSAWVAATPSASGTTPNATPTVPGLVQLAGDLGGTATAPTVPGLAGKANTASLAAVATSGSYGDLTGRPLLAVVATSGAYTDLSGRPALATVATSGAYTDLTARPALATVATSGSYTDLTNKPAAGASVQFAAKAAPTSVTSNTTPALDPDLVATVTPGTYLFELFALYTCTSGTAGLKLALGGTATRGTPTGGVFHLNAGSPTVFGAVAWSGAATNGGTGMANAPTSYPLTARILVPVTAGGTLGLSWSQAASDTSAMQLLGGSSLTLTKIA